MFFGFLLSKTDQDALNATIEVWIGKASIVGQERMAFKHGGCLMFHALGSSNLEEKLSIQLVKRQNCVAPMQAILEACQALSIVIRTVMKRKIFAQKLTFFLERLYSR